MLNNKLCAKIIRISISLALPLVTSNNLSKLINNIISQNIIQIINQISEFLKCP